MAPPNQTPLPPIPVYVMLPLDILDEHHNVRYGQLPEGADPASQQEKLKEKLKVHLMKLKSAGVEGVMVDCWWGRVEAKGPGQYNWTGYKTLFSIVRDAGLKLHVVMSFHACLENEVETIPLPGWVKRIGQEKDLFYKDAHDNPSTEYLSWAVDKKPVLKDQIGHRVSPLQVYENFMSEFKKNMSEFLHETITMIEVGLGPSGELRYPAYRLPWEFKGTDMGVGEFQCYDNYMMESWKNEAEGRGFTIPCCVGPQTAGNYTSTPKETQFFQGGAVLTNGISYTETYGKTFLSWYSEKLVDHGRKVLEIADQIFKPVGVEIAAKVPGIYWYCNEASRAAEATAGLVTGPPDVLSVYRSIAGILNNLGATFIFTCVEKKDVAGNDTDRPEVLVQQVLGEARRKHASIACENGSEAYGDDLYDQIFKVATDYNISYFTYMRLCANLMEGENGNNWTNFEAFMDKMKNPNQHLPNASTSQPQQ